MRRNLLLGQRIGLGFGLMILLVLVTSGLGLWYTALIQRTVQLTSVGAEQIEHLSAVQQSWSDVIASIDRILLNRQVGLIGQELESQLVLFTTNLNTLETGPLGGSNEEISEQNRLILQNLHLLGEQQVEYVNEIYSNVLEGHWAKAQLIRHTELNSVERRFQQTLTDFRDNVDLDVEALVAESAQLQNRARLFWTIGVVVSVIAGGTIGYVITRSVTRPVQDLILQTERVRIGEFEDFAILARQDEIGQLSRAFAEMSHELRQVYRSQEKQISERTKTLETSYEISRRLSTILEQQELLTEVVNEVRNAFGYYHVHVYLLNETGERLKIAGGSGPAGKVLLSSGHQLHIGQGIVGQVARNQTPLLIEDVTLSPNWLPNPLLPETKAEIAVPILFGSQLLGVLDVQHHIPGRLLEEDVAILQGIASQLAIALQNAQLYEQAQSRARREATLNTIGQKIQNATTLERVLQIAAQELGQNLGVHRAVVEIGQRSGRDQNGQS